MGVAEPGRHGGFRYEQLCKEEYNEFGKWALHGGIMQIVDSVVVIHYGGERIVEIHPDDTCYLIIPKVMSNAITKRWAQLSGQTDFSYEKKKRASGLTEYLIKRYSYTQEYRHPYKKTGEVLCTSKVRYNLDGTITTDGVPQYHASKDNPKYRAFNVKLKGLRALLMTQIKMEVHDTSSFEQRNLIRLQVDAFVNAAAPGVGVDLGARNFNVWNIDARAYVLVQTWMLSQDPVVAKHIAWLAFTHISSEAKGNQAMMRQVGNLLRRAQNYYLRKHCVTITEAIPGSHNDQQSELQPVDGLREVPLPGQA